jgi:hypothetical protein
MSRTLGQRKIIAHDTVTQSPSVVAETPGASEASTFVAAQLPPMDASANPWYGETAMRIVNSDSFTVARAMARSTPDATDKIAVLNLASDMLPGGGWIETLCRTQACAFLASLRAYAKDAAV